VVLRERLAGRARRPELRELDRRDAELPVGMNRDVLGERGTKARRAECRSSAGSRGGA
jgi:hypothetical protein